MINRITLFLIITIASCNALAQNRLDNLSVSVKVDRSDQVSVTYDVPSDITELRLVEDNPILDHYRKQTWKFKENCAIYKKGLIVRKPTANCEKLHLTISAAPLNQDRMYEPVVKLSEGLLVHTKYFAVRTKSPVTWNFLGSDDGYVMAGNQVIKGSYTSTVTGEIPQDVSGAGRDRIDNAYVALNKTPPVRWRGLNVVISHNIPKRLVADIHVSLEKISDVYQAFFGALDRPPLIVITHQYDEVTAPMRMNGETSFGLIRINVNNPQPMLTKESKAYFYRFATHELFHAWNSRPGLLRSQEPWLVEGNAEWIGFNTMRLLNFIDEKDVYASIENQINECIVTVGTTPWEKSFIKNYGTAPYRCGFTFHLADAANIDPSLDPSKTLRTWSERFKSAAGINAKNFVFSDENAGPFAAAWERMINKQIAFDEAIQHLLTTARINYTIRNVPNEPQLQRNVTYNMYAQIQRQKCKGVAFRGEEKGIRSFEEAQCPWQKKHIIVDSAENISLIDEPLNAAQAILAKCEKNASFSLAGEGETYEVSCPIKFDLPKGFFTISPVRYMGTGN